MRTVLCTSTHMCSVTVLMRHLNVFATVVAATSYVSAKKSGGGSCDKSEFYGKTSVADLCDDHFPDKTSENVWMVEFYAPWCGHCKALKPKYIDAAKAVKKSGDEGLKFGAVDCTKEQELCQRYGVKGYPTIKAFVGGKAKEYQGPRETDDMIAFLKNLRDSKGTKGGSAKCASTLVDASKKETIPLCASHFPDKKGKNNWVIVFHPEIAKDDLKATRKNLHALADKVTAGGAKLGVVDCSANADLCASKLGADSVSTITVKTYVKGKADVSAEAFAEGLADTSAVIDFVKAQLGSKFKVASVENDEL